jgi:hypothetical protein
MIAPFSPLEKDYSKIMIPEGELRRSKPVVRT